MLYHLISGKKFENSPELKHWATIENLKIAAANYSEIDSITELEHKISIQTQAGKSTKQSVVELEHRIKDLSEIIKYVEQYKANHSYNIGYIKSKNPDTYFRKYESQLILYGGAKRMLEQAGINLKSLNANKLKFEYEELIKPKSELAAAYKKCEKEVYILTQKLEKISQYLEHGVTPSSPKTHKRNERKSL